MHQHQFGRKPTILKRFQKKQQFTYIRKGILYQIRSHTLTDTDRSRRRCQTLSLRAKRIARTPLIHSHKHAHQNRTRCGRTDTQTLANPKFIFLTNSDGVAYSSFFTLGQQKWQHCALHRIANDPSNQSWPFFYSPTIFSSCCPYAATARHAIRTLASRIKRPPVRLTCSILGARSMASPSMVCVCVGIGERHGEVLRDRARARTRARKNNSGQNRIVFGGVREEEDRKRFGRGDEEPRGVVRCWWWLWWIVVLRVFVCFCIG